MSDPVSGSASEPVSATLDANLAAAVAAIQAEAKAETAAPAVAPNYQQIVDGVRAATIPGSPLAADGVALAHFNLVFIPALIAALQGA